MGAEFTLFHMTFELGNSIHHCFLSRTIYGSSYGDVKYFYREFSSLRLRVIKSLFPHKFLLLYITHMPRYPALYMKINPILNRWLIMKKNRRVTHFSIFYSNLTVIFRIRFKKFTILLHLFSALFSKDLIFNQQFQETELTYTK